MKYSAKDRRLEGETLLRQCQLTQLYILHVFDEICTANNLRYFLDGGTLLGAIRHNGFIPWDDDVDVSMPIEDYKKFIEIADSVLPDDLVIQHPKNCPGARAPITRMRDRCSFYAEGGTIIDQPCGIAIDIFPVIRFPLMTLGFNRFITDTCMKAWQSEAAHRTLHHGSIASMYISSVKAIVWRVVHDISRFVIWVMSLYRPLRWHFIPEIGRDKYEGLTDEDLFPLKRHVFEDGMFFVPNNPEKLLQQFYGDWRTPPPPSQRTIVHNLGVVCPTQAPNVSWAREYQCK